jgi:hypothetical protein
MGHPVVSGESYLDLAGFLEGVGSVAAPLPEVWFGDEVVCDWVSVDVAELFYALAFCVDIEVIVARFPDVFFGSCAGETLLEDLHADGEFRLFRFGDEKMHMVGHDDVAEDVETIFLTGFFEDAEESVFGFRGAQDWSFACAAEGEEVQVAGLLEAF